MMKDTFLPQPRLLRKRPMARIISVSPRTLDTLAKEGIVPFNRIKGLILFDPEAVIKALKAYGKATK